MLQFCIRMKKLSSNIVLVIIFLISVNVSLSQDILADTLQGTIEEVVVTATRTERKLSNVTIPTSIISQKQIVQAGSLRLKDVLQEQAGLFITSGFGSGVQLQGLNPDYTLILIDGEPLVGRTAGVLDLQRITVGNIKKVEIVKGPVSSLYGSEAMAGVINIITDKSKQTKLNSSIRYGTYNTLDANITSAFRLKNISINGFVNSYSTNGFSIRPFSVERTVAPLWRFTNQWNVNIPFGIKTKLNIAVRNNYENIKNEIAVTNTGSVTYSQGSEVNKDWNLNPVLIHNFNNKLKSTVRVYATQFNSHQQLNSSIGSLYNDQFNHQFLRLENQTDYNINENVSLTAGLGHIVESINSTRYNNNYAKKSNNINYGFIQSEINPHHKLKLITGIRIDDNKLYSTAVSPKISFLYKINSHLNFTGSFGRGFKAPDFRQLYLNFTNTAAGGYSVYGTLEAKRVIEELNKLGQIASYESDYYRLSDLKPEYSNGLHIGLQYQKKKSIFKLNVFRNDIENLIDSRLIANKTNGSQIFSYLNVKKAYTQGLEFEATIKEIKNLEISSGYQLLYTADKQQLTDIKNGLVFTKDANGYSKKINSSDYVGLPNRSRHMANFKIEYQIPTQNIFIYKRAIYRSKWAVNDKDGNGLYNSNDEFANGFVQFNISAGKTFSNKYKIQCGIDNVFNYSDVYNLPNYPGRQIYFSINYSFIKNKN